MEHGRVSGAAVRGMGSNGNTGQQKTTSDFFPRYLVLFSRSWMDMISVELRREGNQTGQGCVRPTG